MDDAQCCTSQCCTPQWPARSALNHLILGLPKSANSCILCSCSFVRLYQQCQQQCLLPLCEISTCTIRVSYTLHHRRTVDNRCAPVQPAQRRYNRPRPTRTSCNRLNRLQPVPAPVASLHRLYRYRLQSHQSVVPVPVTGQNFSRSATDRLSDSATHYLWCVLYTTEAYIIPSSRIYCPWA
jgi:hypothetical protein